MPHPARILGFACAAALLFTLYASEAAAQTTIPGGNYSTQTWTLAGSPYTVQGDVTIPDGQTLTIQAGVEVRFSTSDALGGGLDTAEVELRIAGTLITQGTPSNPVIFNSTGTGAGSWYGVVLISTAANVNISGIEISEAQYGVYIDSSSTTNVIQDSVLHNNSRAIWTSGTGRLDLRNSVIRNNSSQGITLNWINGSPNSVIDHCTFNSNNFASVNIDTNTGTTASLAFTNNISTNHSYGIYRDVALGTVTVTNTNIWGNVTATNQVDLSNPSNLASNPLYNNLTDLRLTQNSPCRFAASDGGDIGARPYTTDPTSGLLGTLWTNTTLSAGNYTVTGDLTVPPGVTLTVAPGAILSFSTSDTMMAGVDTSEVELRVVGSLVTQGTASNPTVFNSTGTGAGSWYGIVLTPTAANVNLTGVEISEAQYGVYIDSSSTTNVIQDSVLHNNSRAIWTSGTGRLDLRNSVIRNNSSQGITLNWINGSPNSVIDHCTFNSNNFASVNIDTNTGTTASLAFTNNISTNHSYGIYRDVALGTVTVTNTNIWGNVTATNQVDLSNPSNLASNPLYNNLTDLRLTQNSPCRFAASDGGDIGARPYTTDPTAGLLGTLWTNTTLSAGNYTVTGDLTVPSGVTLTVAPGAILSFSTSDTMMAGVDTSEVELRIVGSLVTQGTASNPTVFNSTGTGAGSWYGVILTPTATDVDLSGVEISEAQYGVYIDSSSTTNVIQDSVLHNNSRAIWTSGIGRLDLRNSVIRNNSSQGITLNWINGSPNSVIDHCTFNSNNFASVNIDTNTGTTASLAFTNNISTNHSYGIYRDVALGTVTVTNTNIWGNVTATNQVDLSNTSNLASNPLYNNLTDLRLTQNSPCRFAASDGGDIGARPYTTDPTSGLLGTLWTNTTLSAGNYTVTGDLTVPVGVTLTVAPGAILSFSTSDTMMAGVDTSEVELRVVGSLVTQGTASNLVVFNSTGTGAGSWYGVILTPTATNVNLTGVEVTEAQYGVYIDTPSTTNVIQRSLFHNNSRAIFTTINGRLEFINSVVRNNSSQGITLTWGIGSPNAKILNSTFNSNNFAGVNVDTNTGATATLDVTNSIFTNHSYGLYRDVALGTVNVTYCDVWGNVTASNQISLTSPSNLAINPLYTSSADLSLQPTSPCVDAGTNTGAPTSDFNGALRPRDGNNDTIPVTDMGAFEYTPVSVCGDNVLNAGEACDDGGNNGLYGFCNGTCTGPGPRCGDNTVNGPEACDDANTDNTDACLNTCQTATCGDGFIRAGTETCDDANTINTDACTAACQTAICGDGIVRAGFETCDDANANNTDACLSNCEPASCGDGFVHAGVEACDDGNPSNTDACLNACDVASCGDGFVQEGIETCDDANTISTDTCTASCQIAICGDGIVHAGQESCDDANTSNTDACLSSCEPASCGDGFVHAGEEPCDDGNTIDTDACLTGCIAARCGDGVVGPGEACDDANTDNDDLCTNACALASCGDGLVQLGEACDDANLDDTDACLSTCVEASCGDGFLQDGVEACDDGNQDNTDDCLPTCEAATCGDGFVQDSVEACDDGNQDDTDDCLSTCEAASCGDGFVQAPEECDDANQDNTDACTNTCTQAFCGDGFVQAPEECDDANSIDIDTCTTACALASCGDGFVQPGESCDDGNQIDDDGCRTNCAPSTCGDAIIQAGEACDDGNTSNTDACLNTCRLAACGDGFLHAAQEECDDANADNTDACLATCISATCGDGLVWAGQESCDDANQDDTDACTNTCALASCGDGFLQAGEACDDQNTQDGDGCSATCTTETPDEDTNTTADETNTDTTSGDTNSPDTAPADTSSDVLLSDATPTETQGSEEDCSCNNTRRSSSNMPLSLGMFLSLLALTCWRRRR